jgi:hypothetical protein
VITSLGRIVIIVLIRGDHCVGFKVYEIESDTELEYVRMIIRTR